MNYTFPQIQHYNDILPHITGRDEFVTIEKDGYIAVNYVVALEETFLWDSNDSLGSVIRRECRGLIFDLNWNLISRPYHKFFNVGEKEETQIHLIDLDQPHTILQKLDGSMIRPIPIREGFRLATKAGITSVAMNAEVFIADKLNYSQFINKCIQKNTTPIFEWVSRKNRIVIDYPEESLILTAIRHNKTGEYIAYTTIKTYAESYNIPVVDVISSENNSPQELIEFVRKWDDNEGVVIRFDNGHMLKIKADDYVLRHKSKEQISQEKNVIQIIVTDIVDDVIPLLTPEDTNRLKDFQVKFWEGVNNLAAKMESLYQEGISMYPDQKSFAVEFVQRQVDPKFVHIMYSMRGGTLAKEVISNMITKSTINQTKLNQNRWLWGNHQWNV
jgi:RNA ligase